jgi:hypothetical protein
MSLAPVRSSVALLALLLIACSGGQAPQAQAPPPPSATPLATPATPPPPTAAPSPTPAPVRRELTASRLTIPALNIDAAVGVSRTVPDTSTAPPGCPPRPAGGETLTVPNEGIATPAQTLEGLENKAWIFGHSRWLGRNGLLFALQDIKPNDEVFVSGVDRLTGQQLERQRYVVTGIYLTDTDSGETLVNAGGPNEVPAKPLVVLQTSVRESGAGKQWILDRSKLMAKATNLVQGDINDPCKYLLLFVFAESA